MTKDNYFDKAEDGYIEMGYVSSTDSRDLGEARISIFGKDNRLVVEARLPFTSFARIALKHMGRMSIKFFRFKENK